MNIQTEMLEALTEMLDPEMFGVEATYKGNTVNVIFSNPAAEFSPLDAIVMTTKPSARGLASDFAAWQRDDPIIIGGVTYRITQPPIPDDVGFCDLILCK